MSDVFWARRVPTPRPPTDFGAMTFDQSTQWIFFLSSPSQFGHNFIHTPYETNWVIITQFEHVGYFRYKGDKQWVASRCERICCFKVLVKSYDITFKCFPFRFNEFESVTIGAQRFLPTTTLNSTFSFLNCKRRFHEGRLVQEELLIVGLINLGLLGHCSWNLAA